jgi:aldose 1-epimerase
LKYTLEGGALIMEYEAIPESKTAIALTNHSHFNLSGFKSDVLSHKVTIFADRYTEIDGRRIPTGERPDVHGTRFDFREPHEIGERGHDGEYGYDHNFILKPERFGEFSGKRLALSAIAEGELLHFEVYTDQSGLQFYTGNFLSGGPRLFGTVEKTKHKTFCLEAQTEPNCVSNGIGIYDAGERYLQTTVFKISKI